MACRPFIHAFTLAALCAVLGSPQAAVITLSVKVQNFAPASGIAFAPLHVGFGRGIFDAFDIGGVATAPIISVAEGGSGSAWQPAFAAAEPLATRCYRRPPVFVRRDGQPDLHGRHRAQSLLQLCVDGRPEQRFLYR